MKPLREGYTTGVCAAAAALASVLWQTTGTCPERIAYTLPSGKSLSLAVEPQEAPICGIRKDAGDDPDQTNGCLVCAKVEIGTTDGAVTFQAGEGVGIVTKKGLRVPVGEPAINPIDAPNDDYRGSAVGNRNTQCHRNHFCSEWRTDCRTYI